tara:strand:- start:374 stop:613 length:240 start_codon:yes stop_codon:yes gene_type:complete
MFNKIWYKLTNKKELNMTQTDSKIVKELKEQLKQQTKETAKLKGRLAEVSEDFSELKSDLNNFKQAVTRDLRKVSDKLS